VGTRLRFDRQYTLALVFSCLMCDIACDIVLLRKASHSPHKKFGKIYKKIKQKIDSHIDQCLVVSFTKSIIT
jgi:hypothetical protein